jgi:thymidine phosphorylase
LGVAIIELGGGRKVMTDKINHSVGLEMLARIGDRVEKNQPLVRVFASQTGFERVKHIIADAFSFTPQPVPPLPPIVDRMD